MAHSALTVSDHQYLHAFRQLFPTRLLRRAVAASHPDTRRRKLPLHLLLGVLATWFFKPDAGLPALLRWLLDARHDPLAEPSLYLARARLGWAPLRRRRRRAAR
ncbi:MAG: transposase domain-containing protein, partial [Gemmataceae bacterium]|nr:transposase domain-containing protein [Gemmataceae bacterium]